MGEKWVMWVETWPPLPSSSVQATRVVFQKQKVHEHTARAFVLAAAARAHAAALYTRQLTDSLLFSLFIYPGQHTSSCPAHPQREKSCSFERKTHYKAAARYSLSWALNILESWQKKLLSASFKVPILCTKPNAEWRARREREITTSWS
jgi:hypothetical protein